MNRSLLLTSTTKIGISTFRLPASSLNSNAPDSYRVARNRRRGVARRRKGHLGVESFAIGSCHGSLPEQQTLTRANSILIAGVDPFNWKLLLSRTTSIKSPSVLAVFTSRKLMSRFSGASFLDFVINSRA